MTPGASFGTGPELPPGASGWAMRTLGDIVPLNARRHGAKVAIQEWDGARLRDTTYAQLARLVAGFSGLLRRRGVGPGDRVAILMPNGRAWVVAYFGVIGLGAVAVPLDYEFLDAAPENLRFAIGHAGVRLVVVSPADVARARPLAGGRVLPFDGSSEPVSASDSEEERARPSEVAEILYTSGTTGRRKGVMLTHANVLANVRACISRFGVRGDDCLPAFLPHHHAYPLTTTVVVPLYAGARMPIADVRDRTLGEFLRQARPTVLVAVPRVYEALLAGIDHAARARGALRRLRRAEAVSAAVKRLTGVNAGKLLFRGLHRRLFGGMQVRLCISGGARLRPETALRCLRLGIPLVQGWGMTELSPVGAVQPYHAFRFWLTRHYERQAGSIGTPLDGTQMSLVDVPEQDIWVDRDGRGELVVRGPHVMAGYYRDPEGTRQMFCGAGLRTGDIARRDALGHYWIVGRLKHVIVLPGGKKVFPEEDLAEPLSTCPSIEEFAVRPITGADGRETIGIIVRPAAAALRARGVSTFKDLYALLKDEMLRALRDRPAYMRRFDFCLTELRGGEFCELLKTAMKEPCPLRNEFRFETAYSARRCDARPLPLSEGGGTCSE